MQPFCIEKLSSQRQHKLKRGPVASGLPQALGQRRSWDHLPLQLGEHTSFCQAALAGVSPWLLKKISTAVSTFPPAISRNIFACATSTCHLLQALHWPGLICRGTSEIHEGLHIVPHGFHTGRTRCKVQTTSLLHVMVEARAQTMLTCT